MCNHICCEKSTRRALSILRDNAHEIQGAIWINGKLQRLTRSAELIRLMHENDRKNKAMLTEWRQILREAGITKERMFKGV